MGFGIEVGTLPRVSFCLAFGDGDGDEIKLSFGLYKNIWLTYSSRWVSRIWGSDEKKREISVDLWWGEMGLHSSFTLWGHDDGGGYVKKLRDWYVDWDRIIFGRSKCHVEILSEGEAQIDMPEGKYKALYKIEKRTLVWPRRFKKERTSISFDLPVCIPHDGKGENSWDCGMDGTCGISEDYKKHSGSIYQAAKAVALRCLNTRSRYGTLSDFSIEKLKEHGYFIKDGFVNLESK